MFMSYFKNTNDKNMFISANTTFQTTVIANREFNMLPKTEMSDNSSGYFNDSNLVIANHGMTVELMNIFFQPDPWLIILYIPVFLLSVTANSLVIIVVIKYHYMRK